MWGDPQGAGIHGERGPRIRYGTYHGETRRKEPGYREAGTEDKIWHTMLPIAYSTLYPPQIPSYLLVHSLSTVTNLLYWTAALFVGSPAFLRCITQ